MKKLFYNILTMAIIATAAVSFSSCDDERIAHTLEGTWRGNMYISCYYGGRSYDATYTEITFLKDPYAYSSGNGYWVDYYSDAPWDYVANHIDWKVDYGTIYVYFVEEGTSLRISDYHLNDDRFYGWIDDAGTTIAGVTTNGLTTGTITLAPAVPLPPIAQRSKSPSATSEENKIQ